MRLSRLPFAPAMVLGAVLALALPAVAQDEMPDEPGAKHPPAAAPAEPGGGKGVQPEEQAPAEAPPPGTMLDQPFASLQALDKVTARTRRLTVKVGESVRFGTLSIQVDACRKAPPEDPPEAAAFLKITDNRPGQAPVTAFTGWMFQSSPALSAMDHPVYDIWVVDCTSDSTASAAPKQ